MQNIEFSLADGSALIKRLRRLGLFDWIPQNLTFQIMLAVLIAWAPLLVITAGKGQAQAVAEVVEHGGSGILSSSGSAPMAGRVARGF